MKITKLGVLPHLAGVLVAFALSGQAQAFEVSSPDLKAQGMKFSADQGLNGFGCKGKNISPAISWKNLPAGTESLSLMMHDGNAPTGSGFWQWVVVNIPASVSGLPSGAGTGQGALPKGAVAGVTDFLNTGITGAGGYGGPCPPQGRGAHTYTFTLFAVGVPDIFQAAGIPPTGTAALTGFVLNHGLGQKVLGKTSFTATYERP
jgi:Raf kinase inhibitor-like YbhB/YbcL family protein